MLVPCVEQRRTEVKRSIGLHTAHHPFVQVVKMQPSSDSAPQRSILRFNEVLRMATFNVRSLKTVEQQHRLILDIHELQLDITAVQESRLEGDVGRRQLQSSDLTILSSGADHDQHSPTSLPPHVGGVALVVNSLAHRALVDWWPVSAG